MTVVTVCPAIQGQLVVPYNTQGSHIIKFTQQPLSVIIIRQGSQGPGSTLTKGQAVSHFSQGGHHNCKHLGIDLDTAMKPSTRDSEGSG